MRCRSNSSRSCNVFPSEASKAIRDTTCAPVQTRNTLESRLYSWGEEVSSNALEVHIHHLRKKLGADFIKTIRGVGYKVDTA